MEQYNPGQIRKFLKQLRQREEQYIYYLGQLAFQAGEEQRLSEPAMLDAYRTLKDIKTQIAQWEASLAQLKASKDAARRPRCPRCGSEVVQGALYCPSCGGALTAPSGVAMTTAPTVETAPAQAAPMAPIAAMPGPGMPGTVPSPVPGAPVAPPHAPGQVPMPPSAPLRQAASGATPQAVPHAQAAAAATPAQIGRSCPKCGEALDEDALFCGNCGIRVTSDVETPADQPPGAATVPEGGEATKATLEAEGKTGEPALGGTTGGATYAAEAGMPSASVPEGAAASGAIASREASGTAAPAPESAGPVGEASTQPSQAVAKEESAEQPEEFTAEETIACPSCWAAISDLDARFCPNCGTKVRE